MYAEDADLSWRGARRGWRYRYVPASVVHHEHRASSGGERTPRLDYLNRRNRLVVVTRHGGLRGAVGRVGPGARRDRRWRGDRPGRSAASAVTSPTPRVAPAGACGCRCRPPAGRRASRAAVLTVLAVPLTRVRSMRALVTGGLGFVGRHLVEHLRASGDEVDVVDRHGDRAVDITDGPAVQRRHRRRRPDAVYHLAGWADVGGSWAAPGRARSAPTPRAPSTCCSPARPPVSHRVLSVGSADVYGVVTRGRAPAHRGRSPPAGQPVRRQQGRRRLPRAAGLPRPGARRDPRPGVQPPRPGPDRPLRGPRPRRAHRRQRARRRRQPCTVGDLSPRRDFTDVRDVVRAYRLLVERGAPGEVYNVCSGRDLSVQELADHLLTLARHPMQLETDPALLRPVDVPVLRGDATKLRDATGWQPRSPSTRPSPTCSTTSGAAGSRADQRRRDVAPTEAVDRSVDELALSLVAGAFDGARPGGWASRRATSASRRSAHGRSRSRSRRRHCSSTSVWRATTSGRRSALAVG